jgi:hypothetical protein
MHVEEGSFLWGGTKFHIDTIRRYIHNTKFKKYSMKCVVEHNVRTMLLVAEPGVERKVPFLYGTVNKEMETFGFGIKNKPE